MAEKNGNGISRRVLVPVWENLGGTLNPCEVEIDNTSGLYIDPGELRRDPLRMRKKNDPANMGRDQYFDSLIPYGSSAYYQRKQRKSKPKELTGCAAEKARKELEKRMQADCVAIRRRGNTISRIAA